MRCTLSPNPFFSRPGAHHGFVQIAFNSLGVWIELEIPWAQKAHAGSISASGTRNNGLRLMRAFLILGPPLYEQPSRINGFEPHSVTMENTRCVRLICRRCERFDRATHSVVASTFEGGRRAMPE